MMAALNKVNTGPPTTWFDEPCRLVDGKMWLRGTGAVPAKIFIVGDKPGPKDMATKRVFSSSSGTYLMNTLTRVATNIHSAGYYLTNAVKYNPPGNKAVSARDIKTCKPMLDEEIARCKPELIVCLGSQALAAVAGKAYPISSVYGELLDHPELAGVKILPVKNPALVQRAPEHAAAFERELGIIGTWLDGEVKPVPKVDVRLLRSVDDIVEFSSDLLKIDPTPMLSIDMEWDGATWMHENRYVRTLQIGYAIGKCATVEFHDVGGVPVIEDMPGAWVAVKRLLENQNVGIIGHNVIADGEWLLSYGVDIRKRVVWDTMLAEFLLAETGPWGLDELALKYTDYNRYSLTLDMWVRAHADLCRYGYGHVPRELLIPYGAIDVDAPRMIAMKQMPLVEAAGFMEPRGANKEYPSLLATTLRTQELLYEVEMTGMRVDMDRVTSLIKAYQGARSDLLGKITTEAAAIGFRDFSPTSPRDVSALLFKHLQLAPVKTTGGKAWGDQVGNQGLDNDTEENASTDKTTLEILQDAHPIVKHILQFRRIDTACKTWLRSPAEGEDMASTGGGIIAKIWPDGRLHSRFSQLAETGRFRTSKPNVQNFPKKAEGYMEDIFGKDNVPPNIRTIVIPTEGYVMMEADFCQAELFTLAALSGDENMIDALTTPGKDLHDMTACSAFGIVKLGTDGGEISDDQIVAIAKELGVESKEFKDLQKHIVYVDQKGHRMTRDAFKSGIRVSAKNLNFGIP